MRKFVVSNAGMIRFSSRRGERGGLRNAICLLRFGVTVVSIETGKASLTADDPKICGVSANRYRVKYGIENLAIHRELCLSHSMNLEFLWSLFAEKSERETRSNLGCCSNRVSKAKLDGKHGAV